jgi:hypothetical protein
MFPPASVSRPALGPTQPPVQWVPGVLSPGLKHGRGVTLTTHRHLVPRSSMSRSDTTLPQTAFMACSGSALDLTFTTRKSEHLLHNRKFLSFFPVKCVVFHYFTPLSLSLYASKGFKSNPNKVCKLVFLKLWSSDHR